MCTTEQAKHQSVGGRVGNRHSRENFAPEVDCLASRLFRIGRPLFCNSLHVSAAHHGAVCMTCGWWWPTGRPRTRFHSLLTWASHMGANQSTHAHVPWASIPRGDLCSRVADNTHVLHRHCDHRPRRRLPRGACTARSCSFLSSLVMSILQRFAKAQKPSSSSGSSTAASPRIPPTTRMGQF